MFSGFVIGANVLLRSYAKFDAKDNRKEGMGYGVSGIGYQVSGIGYRVSGIGFPLSRE
jgi:hypothetical protein